MSRRNARGFLFIGGPTPGDAMDWAELDLEKGEVAAVGRASRAQDAPIVGDANVVLAIPGVDVQIRRLALPAQTTVQARAGARAAFESLLVTTADTHFALGARQDGDGRRLVAAVARSKVSAWLDACARLEIVPHRIVADFTLLAPPAKCADVVALGDRVVFGAGALGGFAIEAALAPAVLREWLSENGPLKEIVVDAKLAPLFAAPEFAALVGIRSEEGSVRAFAKHALSASHDAPDLRQEEFALAPQRRTPLSITTLAISVAGIAAMTQISANLIAGWRDSQSAHAIESKTEAAYRALRPSVTTVASLDASVRALANARAGAKSHPVLVLSDPLIAAQAAHPGVRLEAIRHAEPGRTVTVTLSAATPQPLEAAARSLETGVSKIALGIMRPENERYVLDVTIETPP